MPGESQQAPKSEPDPSVQTTAQLHTGLGSERDYVDGKVATIEERLRSIDVATQLLNETVNRVPTDVQIEIAHVKEVFALQLKGEREIGLVRESYRLELKGDAKEALTTALAAAEKAVQAALAAAEKARDQQTIASQLATDKAEKAFVEALAQQQNTFTVAIANVVDGLNEVKAGVGDLRAEKRGGSEQRTDQRLNANLLIAVAGLVLAAVIFAFAR